MIANTSANLSVWHRAAKIRQKNVSAEIFLDSEVFLKLDYTQLFSLSAWGPAAGISRLAVKSLFPQSLCLLAAQAGLLGRLQATQGSLQHEGTSTLLHTGEGVFTQFYYKWIIITYLCSFNITSPPSAAGGFRKLKH